MTTSTKNIQIKCLIPTKKNTSSSIKSVKRSVRIKTFKHVRFKSGTLYPEIDYLILKCCRREHCEHLTPLGILHASLFFYVIGWLNGLRLIVLAPALGVVSQVPGGPVSRGQHAFRCINKKQYLALVCEKLKGLSPGLLKTLLAYCKF